MRRAMQISDLAKMSAAQGRWKGVGEWLDSLCGTLPQGLRGERAGIGASSVLSVLPLERTRLGALWQLTLSGTTLGLWSWLCRCRQSLLLRTVFAVRDAVEGSTHVMVDGSDVCVLEQKTVGEGYSQLEKRLGIRLGGQGESRVVRFFDHGKARYYFCAERNEFVSNCAILTQNPPYWSQQSLSTEDREVLRSLCGMNQMEMSDSTFWKCLVDSLRDAWILFQMFSVGVWIAASYYYYAACILGLLGVSLVLQIYSMQRNRREFNALANVRSSIEVFDKQRGWRWTETAELVPGDCVRLERGAHLTADAVIVSGQGHVTEEHLTGETNLVLKTAFENKLESNNLLYSGSTLVRVEGEYVVALVCQTGNNTRKSQALLASSHEESLPCDATQIVLFGFLLLCSAFSIALTCSLETFHDKWRATIKCLDILTIAVPPALAAAKSVAHNVASKRLAKNGVLCHRMLSIMQSAAVDRFVFDKTGTLTESQIVVDGIHDFQAGRLCRNVSECSDAVVDALSVCHSVEFDGERCRLDGAEAAVQLFDPVDTAICAWCAPVACAGKVVTCRQTKLEVLKTVPFCSANASMSVVCKRENGDTWYVTKGAVRAISKLCAGSDMAKVQALSDAYQESGAKVMALAVKHVAPKISYLEATHFTPLSPMEASTAADSNESEAEDALGSIDRDRTCNLQLIALILLKNPCRPTARPTIQLLKEHRVVPIMATGDDVGTAVSAARFTGMLSSNKMLFIGDWRDSKTHWTASIPDSLQTANTDWRQVEREYAVTGPLLHHLSKTNPDSADFLFSHSVVFAAMTEHQKAELCLKLRSQGHVVGMCGDGANDCKAFKSSNFSIAVGSSDAAKIANFTTADPDLTACIKVLHHGRAMTELISRLCNFIFLYSFVQLALLSALQVKSMDITDNQFLWLDFISILPISIFATWTSLKTTMHLPHARTRSSLKHAVYVAGQLLIHFASLATCFCIANAYLLHGAALADTMFLNAAAGTVFCAIKLMLATKNIQNALANPCLMLYVALLCFINVVITWNPHWLPLIAKFVCNEYLNVPVQVRRATFGIQIGTCALALAWDALFLAFADFQL